jgi:hypothetical protein
MTCSQSGIIKLKDNAGYSLWPISFQGSVSNFNKPDLWSYGFYIVGHIN